MNTVTLEGIARNFKSGETKYEHVPTAQFTIQNVTRYWRSSKDGAYNRKVSLFVKAYGKVALELRAMGQKSGSGSIDSFRVVVRGELAKDSYKNRETGKTEYGDTYILARWVNLAVPESAISSPAPRIVVVEEKKVEATATPS